MYSVALYALLALAAAASFHGPHSQLQQNGLQTAPTVLYASAREVLLYCSVLGRDGTPVSGLGADAFRVQEDGLPVTLLHFSTEDVPVSLALVLDHSGSMKSKRAQVEAAALTLLRASNAADETAVFNFADQNYLDQDFTADLTGVAAALERSKSISGGTALYDAVIQAANHLARAAHRTKQVIVVVTDGRDNASSADIEDAIRRVQRTDGPVVYSISLLYEDSGGNMKDARHDLTRLSEETGGVAFFPKSLAEVNSIAAQVARDIRSQYTLSYRPPRTGGVNGYRTLQVIARDAKGKKLEVRTRKGYLLKETPSAP